MIIVTVADVTDSNTISIARARLRGVAVLVVVGAALTTTTLAEELHAYRRAVNIRDDLAKLAAMDFPREPAPPRPWGWREPVALDQRARRMSDAMVQRVTHRAARRDARRRRRSRWLAELACHS